MCETASWGEAALLHKGSRLALRDDREGSGAVEGEDLLVADLHGATVGTNTTL